MKFVLSLLSFLLITFGFIFMKASSNYTIKSKDKCTKEQIEKVDNTMSKIRFYSFSSIVLGIGIIIARIFS